MYKGWVTIFLLGSALLTGCESANSTQELQAAKEASPPSKQAMVQTKQENEPKSDLIVMSEKENVKLYALTNGIKLDINGKEKEFKWTFIRNIGTDPQVFYEDVTGDGKEEAVVIIQTGWGTGLDNYDIHVVNAADLSEFKVQGYEEIVRDRLESHVAKKGDGTLDITVKVHGQEYSFNYGFDPAPKYQQDELYFGGVTIYTFKNQQIKLSLPGSVGISPTYVCDFFITYTFDNAKNEFIADQIEINPIKE